MAASPFVLLPGERLDDLQRKGLLLIQHPDRFCFSADAVLLADFARVRPHEIAVDLGTGTGVLPLLLSAREETAGFDALELDPYQADMARRSVEGNGLSKRLRVITGDLRSLPDVLPRAHYTLVVCNPPYRRQGQGQAASAERDSAVREGSCSFSDVALAARSLLRFSGRFCFCFPADRLSEAFAVCEGQRLTPNRLRFGHALPGKQACLFLAECAFGGRPGLTVLPPLFLRDSEGRETPEIRQIYTQETFP